MTTTSGGIEVTVVFALPDRATEITLRLPPGATLGDAIERSGLADRHRDVDFASSRSGVFGTLAERSFVLSDGDRVEVYRPLLADPKQARNERAAAQSDESDPSA